MLRLLADEEVMPFFVSMASNRPGRVAVEKGWSKRESKTGAEVSSRAGPSHRPSYEGLWDPAPLLGDDENVGTGVGDVYRAEP
jgi:hypothetical protein